MSFTRECGGCAGSGAGDRRCIARHADSELLYDQAYEDRKCLMVTGPFTVESCRRIASFYG